MNFMYCINNFSLTPLNKDQNVYENILKDDKELHKRFNNGKFMNSNNHLIAYSTIHKTTLRIYSLTVSERARRHKEDEKVNSLKRSTTF